MNQVFAITGAPRSGTLWLASCLDASPTWTVEHEPEDPLGRFEGRDRYGQVNSFLLSDWDRLPGGRKSDGPGVRGVIIRRPRDVLTSLYWHHFDVSPKVPDDILREILRSYERWWGWVEAATGDADFILRFDAMVGNEPMVRWIAGEVGIHDIPAGISTESPNPSRARGELPRPFEEVIDRLAWFEDRWWSK